jgi:hypothetical protein
MADSHTAAKTLLLAKCRDYSVAAVAGVAGSEWETRVQAGNKDGYIAGLHRGRLPAVEVFQEGDTWTQLSAGSGGQGLIQARWTMRVHSGMFDQDLAEDQCRAIAYSCLIKIRDTDHFRVGEDVVETFQESPLGYWMEVSISVQMAMSRVDYSFTPDTAPVPDGGAVGGITKTINFGDTSPVSILSLPVGQALSGIQLSVLTAFDGASPTISVGIDGDQGRYLETDQSDLTDADTVWDRDANDSGPRTVKVWIDPGVGATTGQVKVQLMTTASN